MRKLLAAVVLPFVLLAAVGLYPATAQNTTCANRPVGDSSNACANTRFADTAAAKFAPGGANGNIQYNNSGVFGGLAQVDAARGGTGADNSTASVNDTLAYSGTTFIHTTLTTLLNTVCGVTPTACSAFFGYYNVKWYAKCDGVTDDSTAITNADAAAAASGRALYFPAGVCLAQGLNPRRSNLEWFGDGKYLSVIKAVNPGIGFDTLVWFGERTAATQYTNLYVHDLQFNGNGTGSNSVVEDRDIALSTFTHITVTGGSAQGWTSQTDGTTINTNALRNHYIDIESYVNVGKGFWFQGEKDSEFTSLFSHNNNSDGIYWGPANLGTNALCETTENYGASISSRDNLGDGIVFDEVEKFPIASIQSSINSGYGVRFRSTITGCTSTGSNSVNIANASLRNNSLGGIRAADSAYVYGAMFGTIWIRGDNSTVNTTGVQLDGASSVQFGSVDIQAWPGAPVIIEQGTPLGVTTQSTNVHFGSLILLNNGNAGAANNSALSVLNTTSGLQIGNLISQNTKTTGSNYELNVAATVLDMKINSAVVNAATTGNELNVSGADLIINNRETGTRNFIGGPGAGHYSPGGSSPALSACGTTPAIAGTDNAGQVTMGTGTPTSCTITFANAYVSVPFCAVSWQANLASMQYTVSNTAITLTQTATSSNKVNYVCIGAVGG